MYIYIIIGLIVLFILFILYEIYELNTLSVSKYEIVSDKISSEFNNFKIVHISDLHSKQFGKNNIRLINRINFLKPDIIVFSGDIIDNKEKYFDDIISLIKVLGFKYKIYYSFGNHELSLKNIDVNRFVCELEKLNVVVLRDEKVKLYNGNNYINIYGLNHNFNSDKSFNLRQIDLLKSANNNEYNILLLHDPDYIDSVLKYNIDLVFSGHIHGGIIRLGKIGIFSPNKLLFPKYVCGIYEKNKTKLVVSRGLGKSKALVRVNNLPEIVCVNLKSK